MSDNKIWIEKYRPKILDNIVNQRHVVDRLKSFVKQGSLPHMIFAGPPGTGKTCCAIATAREIYGEGWTQNFQETNASDMRGIEVIRTRIKNFSRTKPIGTPFKIIFLDESDALTSDAQHALRRLMEVYSHVTRFIMSCNYSSKIIRPIQSRAAVFRFKLLTMEDVSDYISMIAENEKLKIDRGALEAIYDISGGDLRKATNILQASATLDKTITRDVVYEVAAQAEPQEIKKMLLFAMDANFLESREILKDLLLKRGISGHDIIKQISNEIYNLGISERQMAEVIEKVGEFEYRLQGGNDQIQLEALLAQLALYKN